MIIVGKDGVRGGDRDETHTGRDVLVWPERESERERGKERERARQTDPDSSFFAGGAARRPSPSFIHGGLSVKRKKGASQVDASITRKRNLFFGNGNRSVWRAVTTSISAMQCRAVPLQEKGVGG